MVDMSTYDMVLFAWGSRSTSSVRPPRKESAAARLIAVVVLPTPPFWLAMATIIGGARVKSRGCGHCRKRVRGCQSKGHTTEAIYQALSGGELEKVGRRKW